MCRAIGREFFYAHAPELERSGRHALFELPIFAVILQPDFFQCFVALKEKTVIEFLNAFQKARIVLRLHSKHLSTCIRPRQSRRQKWARTHYTEIRFTTKARSSRR